MIHKAEQIIISTHPIQCGDRRVYTIVKVSEHSWSSGGLISASPVALFIEEGGRWFYTILDSEYGEDPGVLLKLLIP